MGTSRKQVVILLLVFLLCVSTAVAAALDDTLVATAVAVTQSDDYDTSPTLGEDATGEMVVYTSQVFSGGSYSPGVIMCQRLNADGTTSGQAIQISDGTTDDQLPDVSGNRIVYTAFIGTSGLDGKIKVHDLATGTTTELMSEADRVREAHIYGDIVVWTQGWSGNTWVNYFDLNWPSGTTPVIIGGPNPPSSRVNIGSRYVVWEQVVDGQYDIGGFDIYGC